MTSRVLLLAEVFPPQVGGSGRWLWELYRRLPGRIAIVAGHTRGDAEFDRTHALAVERAPLAMANWGVLHAASVLQYARAVGRVRRAIARERPSVVHCGKVLPEGLIARVCGATSGIPYWCYAHGEELRLSETSRELRWLCRTTLAKAEMVIANSNHTRHLLSQNWGVPESRVTVMHPGVDADRFRPAPPDAAARERLGWSNRRVVLTVGALQKRKGQDMLIRALPAIRQRCPDVLYVMAGEGWERPYLEQTAKDVGVESFVQFRSVVAEDDLVECYQQCDLFALPNRQVGWDFEGFGIVLIEAQACGKPVVAGRSGGTADTLREGVTGEIVPCESPDELAMTVTALLEDANRRGTMGAAAREWACERFDWRVLTQQAIQLMDLPRDKDART